MTTDRGRLKLQFRNCAILPRTGASYPIPFSESTYALCLSEPPKYTMKHEVDFRRRKYYNFFSRLLFKIL